MQAESFDFGGARFDFDAEPDREILRFVLSQALFGEATGVYCGRSLYAAETLEAAQFYVKQARQELSHLQLFADIFRTLGLSPEPPHWVIRVLAAHNDYYPLKVLMEHALGEGMVLDIFRDVLLQTLPEHDPRSASIQKKLRVVCKEEEEHVAWGEKETRRLLAENPSLGPAFYGLLELQLALVPYAVRGLEARAPGPSGAEAAAGLRGARAEARLAAGAGARLRAARGTTEAACARSGDRQGPLAAAAQPVFARHQQARSPLHRGARLRAAPKLSPCPSFPRSRSHAAASLRTWSGGASRACITTKASYFFLTPPKELARRLSGQAAWRGSTRHGKYLLAALDDGSSLLLAPGHDRPAVHGLGAQRAAAERQRANSARAPGARSTRCCPRPRTPSRPTYTRT